MKNNWKRKRMLVILSVALSVALISGCGKGSQSDVVQTETGAPSGTSKSAEPGMTVQFWSTYPDKTNIDGYAMNYLRNKFNVDIEFYQATSETYKEKLQLEIASNNVPDWWKNLPFSDYDKMVAQEVVAEIPEELLEKYAPNYMQWLRESTGEQDPLRYVRRNGKVYAMPDLWTPGSNYLVLGMREDWLKKVGIDKTPETIEEVEAALTKFRNDDPDGNGKKDTYGITGTAGAISQIFSSVFGAFGVYPGAFTEKDGKIVLGEIEPGAKEALIVLNRWYKNELIDPEFIVSKEQNLSEKILNEKAGALENPWWEFTPSGAFFSGLYYDKLRENNPNASWVLSPGPKGPNGEAGITQLNPYSSSGVQFGKHMESDQAKLIKYLQIFDDNMSNFETQTNMKYGEEGKTFQVAEDGSYEFLPPYDDEREQVKFGIGSYYSASGSFNDYELQKPFMTKKSLMPIREQAETVGKGKYDIILPIERPIYNEYVEQLNQFTMQNFIDFIVGRKSISEFDNFVAEWKKLGGDKVMEEAQQKYDELKAAK